MMSWICSASMVFQLEQRLGHGFDLSRLSTMSFLARAKLLIDDLPDLGVDLLHRNFGHVLVRGDRASEEHFSLVLAVYHGAISSTCPLGHHAAGESGSTLEIVRSARRHLAHEQFLGDAPAEQTAIVESRRSLSML